MVLCVFFFFVFLFLDPRRGRFTFSGTTQQGREGKSAPPRRRGKKHPHRAAWTSSSFGLWRFLPCALWAGAVFSASFWVGRLGLLLLSIVLPSSSSFGWFPEKKAPAQRAHRRKHHYPNEGEEGSTTQKGEDPKWVVVLSPLSPGAASSACCGWGGRSFFLNKKMKLNLNIYFLTKKCSQTKLSLAWLTEVKFS